MIINELKEIINKIDGDIEVVSMDIQGWCSKIEFARIVYDKGKPYFYVCADGGAEGTPLFIGYDEAAM
jgi:hypothetical protein